MAVGTPYANPSPDGVVNYGLVRQYSRYGTDWNMFQQMNNGLFCGYSVDLSHDGSTLAIYARDIAVYIYAFNNFTSLYDLLHTITDDVWSGEVYVSGDGSTVGVTTSSSVGARIFVRDGYRFQQRGSAFIDHGSDGSGIALSYDGTMVGIVLYNWPSIFNISYRGLVSVFQWSYE